MNAMSSKPARQALRVGLLALAALGMAASSWAAECEDAASACATSADALAPVAAPDTRALLEAHSRSRKAQETQRTLKKQPPRPKQMPPRIEPGQTPDFLPQLPHVSQRRTPTISPFVPQQDHGEDCDLEGFATKSGQALSDHIRAQTYRCFDELFGGGSLEFRVAVFKMRNMIDVARATVELMDIYEGRNTDHLYSKHYLFLRIGYYNHSADADHMDWGHGSALTTVTEAVVEAVDAFIENDHFLDHTETHCETAWEIYSMLEGSYFIDYLVRYLPALKSWLDALGPDHAELYEVVSATNGIIGILDAAHQAPNFVAAASDSDLVATLRSLALRDEFLGTTAELLLGNAGYSLAQFLQYDSAPIYREVVDGIRAILDRYDRSNSDEIGVWLETARIVSRHGKCAEFEICGFEMELEAQVLSVSHTCPQVDVHIRAQDLTDADLARACRSMAQTGDRFHALLNTGREPVADDHNAHLEIIVYANWDDYDTYSGLFFGNDTDNGGIYYEGDPADPDNLAQFFVYVADWLPERRVWNLEHEYVHYLDGRFNLYGEFTLDYDTLWWIEGLAEYVSIGNANERAIEIAQSPDFSLYELFSTTYDHSADRVYRWGYLAVRFMFEEHPEHVSRIVGHLRVGCFAENDRYQNQVIGSTLNDEWLNWLDSVSATGAFMETRGVTSDRVDCGIRTGSGDGDSDGGTRTSAHVALVDIFPLGESKALDVSAFFRGFGADAVFSVSSSDPEVVAATINGRALTLLAVSAGEAVVSMTASQGDRSVTRTLFVEVAEVCPPYVCRSWTDGWRLQILLDSLDRGVPPR